MRSNIYDNLERIMSERASAVNVDLISIGLGYTAVRTSDGSCGVSFTYFTRGSNCTVVKHPMEFEGRPASEMLKLIHSDVLIERAAAIALINALNQGASGSMAEDDGSMFERLGIVRGTKCAMVGFFGPVVNRLKEVDAHIELVDESKGLGDQERFYRYLEQEADVLILTSTSLINGSTETVLGRLREDARCIMLGPTTPLVPGAFSHLPVDYLGGISVTDSEGVLRAVRHGKGTPVINRSSRKVLIPVYRNTQPPNSTTAGRESRSGSSETPEK